MIHCLSIQQPWAWAIVRGYKDIENRNWRTNYRGRILIHAGKVEDIGSVWPVLTITSQRTGQPSFEDQRLNYMRFVRKGGIVGEATLVDCVQNHESRWFNGPFGFVLTNQKMYAEMVPMRGQLGIFQISDWREQVVADEVASCD